MKKAISFFLLLCFPFLLFGRVSAKTYDDMSDIKSQILAYTQEWFMTNFAEHYYITSYNSYIDSFRLSGDTIHTVISAGAITTLKYDSVEELPYVIGIKDKLSIKSMAEVIPPEYVDQYEAAERELQKSIALATKDTLHVPIDPKTRKSNLTTQMANNSIVEALNVPVTEIQAENLSRYISDIFIDAAECIGVGTLLTLELCVDANIDNGVITQIWLYEAHDGNATSAATALIPKTRNEMIKQAGEDIDNYLNSEASTITRTQTRGLSTYDRIAARDYAWEHTYPGYGVNTSNANLDGSRAQYDCGHGYYVDRNYWNDDDYPISTCLWWSHCHNDCACFVSQCLAAGGITTTSNWEFPSSGDPTYAWHNTTELKKYMTNNGYWDTSTFAACNAGNVVYTSSGHVTLCTLNDTVTRRYTCHTSDWNNHIYSSAYAYYTINTN